VLWTPLNLPGSFEWYDFTDPLTVTAVGGKMSQITSKGAGAGLLMRQTALNRQPFYTPADSLPARGEITASNNNETRLFPVVDEAAAIDTSMFAVVQVATDTNTAVYPIWTSLTDPGSESNVMSPSNQWQGSQREFGGRMNGVDGPHIWSGISVPLYATVTVNGLNAAGAYRFGIGGKWHDPYGAGDCRGKYFHVILTRGVISLADTQRIEGWAAWNTGLAPLGLVAKLPSGHPYKNAPPYV
jgi:hypothetical protein